MQGLGPCTSISFLLIKGSFFSECGHHSGTWGSPGHCSCPLLTSFQESKCLCPVFHLYELFYPFFSHTLRKCWPLPYWKNTTSSKEIISSSKTGVFLNTNKKLPISGWNTLLIPILLSKGFSYCLLEDRKWSHLGLSYCFQDSDPDLDLALVL